MDQLVNELVRRSQELYELKKYIQREREERKLKRELKQKEDDLKTFFYEVQVRSIRAQDGGDCKLSCRNLRPRNEMKFSKGAFKTLYESEMFRWKELTITFTQNYRAMFDDEEIAGILYQELIYLRPRSMNIVLIPEWGEKSNNLHYHGIISGSPSGMNKIKRQLEVRFGRTELKTISYPKSYYNYVIKDIDKNLEAGTVYEDFFIII